MNNFSPPFRVRGIKKTRERIGKVYGSEDIYDFDMVSTYESRKVMNSVVS